MTEIHPVPAVSTGTMLPDNCRRFAFYPDEERIMKKLAPTLWHKLLLILGAAFLVIGGGVMLFSEITQNAERTAANAIDPDFDDDDYDEQYDAKYAHADAAIDALATQGVGAAFVNFGALSGLTYILLMAATTRRRSPIELELEKEREQAEYDSYMAKRWPSGKPQ